jgi:hypothetical protein
LEDDDADAGDDADFDGEDDEDIPQKNNYIFIVYMQCIHCNAMQK